MNAGDHGFIKFRLLTAASDLCSEFVEHFGVGLHEANEKFRFEDAQRATIRAGFGEALEFVGTGAGGVEQDRLRMPGMAFDEAGCGVVTRDGEDVGFFAKENRQGSVNFLDGLAFGVEVAVFAVHVGVFEVYEEIVVVVVFGEVTLELFSDGLRAFELGHADELSETFVHRINGDAAGTQTVTILESRNMRLMRDAAEKKSIGGLLF